MTNKLRCPLCEGKQLFLDDVYDVCSLCGLQVKRDFQSVEITNESLDKKEILKKDGLTKFKISCVLAIDDKREGLLDIGTASGKFLYHSKPFFKHVQGVEVNHKCIEFAKQELELRLVDSLDKVDLDKVTCVTFWHSLEHIPLEISRMLLSQIGKLKIKTPIIISVPNADSYQFKLFGSLWPYYDERSHLFQYSPRALILLMEQSGYVLNKKKVAPLYEIFGYLQGYVNRFHPISNYFYYRKKRGWDFQLSNNKLLILDCFNYFLLMLFLPVACLSLLMSMWGREGVINYIFYKQ